MLVNVTVMYCKKYCYFLASHQAEKGHNPTSNVGAKPDLMGAGEPMSTDAANNQKDKGKALGKVRSEPVVLLEPLSSDVSFVNILNPYPAKLFVSVFHAFEAGIANAISSFD